MNNNDYRTKQWYEFRNQVIQFDGNKCVNCGDSYNGGEVFHVHHKRYIPGLKPWAYPVCDCETLCKRCHASKHGVVPPKYGWHYEGEDDLGDLCGTCERCGNDIRYVHIVWHEDWGVMEVGEWCCDDMIGTAEASEERKKRERLERFLESPRWDYSTNEYKIKLLKFQIVIRKVGIHWKLWVNGKEGKLLFDSVEKAKTKVFYSAVSGKLGPIIK